MIWGCGADLTKSRVHYLGYSLKSTLFWLGCFILQFMLFRSYCHREIIPFIPENMDQVGYLRVTYDIYDLFLKRDFGKGILYLFNNSVNSGMPLVGAVHLFIFGFSRFSLLISNFIALYSCEIVGVKVLKKITLSNNIPIIYMGLLLMCNAIFAAVGGIFDYRWDFMAFALYIIWISYLAEYCYFGTKESFVRSAVMCGILLFIRLNTVIYVGIVLLVLFLIEIVKKENRKEIVKNWCIYAGIAFIFGGWYLIINFKGFLGYYFSALFTSSSREAWKIHMDFADNLLFYPRLLYSALMGRKPFVLCIALIISGWLGGLKNQKSIYREKSKLWIVVVLVFLVPFGVLTVMDNKNSAAAMILISSLIISASLLFHGIENINQISKRMVKAGAIIILIMGVATFAQNIMSEYPYHSKENAQNCTEANAIIGKYMEANRMQQATIIFDRLLYDFFPTTIEVYSREALDRNIQVRYAIPSMAGDYLMTEFDESELEKGLGIADLLVVSPQGYVDQSPYITDQTLDKYRNIIMKYAADNMRFIGKQTYDEIELEIYASPMITINTEWSDWLGKENTDIFFDNAQGDFNRLILKGEYPYQYNDLYVEAITNEGYKLPMELLLKENEYLIKIDISKCIGRQDVHLIFSDCFVPSKEGESEDQRMLSVCYPSKIYMER